MSSASVAQLSTPFIDTSIRQPVTGAAPSGGAVHCNPIRSEPIASAVNPVTAIGVINLSVRAEATLEYAPSPTRFIAATR